MYISDSTRQRLLQERVELIEDKIPAVHDAIVHARSQGDISENPDVFVAMAEEGRLLQRLAEIDEALSVDSQAPAGDVVEPGCYVTVAFDDGSSERYVIGSVAEADPSADTVTVDSPLGQALLGRVIGDQAVAQTPAGSFTVEVLAIDVA